MFSNQIISISFVQYGIAHFQRKWDVAEAVNAFIAGEKMHIQLETCGQLDNVTSADVSLDSFLQAS